MGVVTLILLLAIETFFLVWSIISKENHREEKSIIRISTLILLALLLVTGVYEWGFRYIMLLIVLIIQSIIGVVILVKKKEKEYKLNKNILGFIRNGFIFTTALFLAILCPQYVQLKTTGSYEIAKAKYTWIDQSRIEQFTQTGENRALTVEFWYPENADETFPLAVFSHGAYGFSGSNYSTFAELASNGYIVASIGHTYHAFYTMDTSGKITIVNPSFINSVNEINAINDIDHVEQVYNTTREWMNLRTDDVNFVLNTILANTDTDKADPLFSRINTDKIGLFGHSLGGASSAQLGRDRKDIDAVIDLDGTMLGEQIAIVNGVVMLNNTPYPVPLLNIYAEDHYKNAKKIAGDEYENFNATKNALCAYEVVFKNSGHLNFTDLPLFSPVLAKMLGVGTVDERTCIETTNKIVLEFFNCFLKDRGTPKFEKEY